MEPLPSWVVVGFWLLVVAVLVVASRPSLRSRASALLGGDRGGRVVGSAIVDKWRDAEQVRQRRPHGTSSDAHIVVSMPDAPSPAAAAVRLRFFRDWLVRRSGTDGDAVPDAAVPALERSAAAAEEGYPRHSRECAP